MASLFGSDETGEALEPEVVPVDLSAWLGHRPRRQHRGSRLQQRHSRALRQRQSYVLHYATALATILAW